MAGKLVDSNAISRTTRDKLYFLSFTPARRKELKNHLANIDPRYPRDRPHPAERVLEAARHLLVEDFEADYERESESSMPGPIVDPVSTPVVKPTLLWEPEPMSKPTPKIIAETKRERIRENLLLHDPDTARIMLEPILSYPKFAAEDPQVAYSPSATAMSTTGPMLTPASKPTIVREHDRILHNVCKATITRHDPECAKHAQPPEIPYPKPNAETPQVLHSPPATTAPTMTAQYSQRPQPKSEPINNEDEERRRRWEYWSRMFRLIKRYILHVRQRRYRRQPSTDKSKSSQRLPAKTRKREVESGANGVTPARNERILGLHHRRQRQRPTQDRRASARQRRRGVSERDP